MTEVRLASARPSSETFFAPIGRIAHALHNRATLFGSSVIALNETFLHAIHRGYSISSDVPFRDSLAHIFLGEFAETVASELIPADRSRNLRLGATAIAAFSFNALIELAVSGGHNPLGSSVRTDTLQDALMMSAGWLSGVLQDERMWQKSPSV